MKTPTQKEECKHGFKKGDAGSWCNFDDCVKQTTPLCNISKEDVNKLSEEENRAFDEQFRHKDNCKLFTLDFDFGCDCGIDEVKQFIADLKAQAEVKAVQGERNEFIKEFLLAMEIHPDNTALQTLKMVITTDEWKTLNQPTT